MGRDHNVVKSELSQSCPNRCVPLRDQSGAIWNALLNMLVLLGIGGGEIDRPKSHIFEFKGQSEPDILEAAVDNRIPECTVEMVMENFLS